jgi:hypothetical protein
MSANSEAPIVTLSNSRYVDSIPQKCSWGREVLMAPIMTSSTSRYADSIPQKCLWGRVCVFVSGCLVLYSYASTR